MPGWEIALVGVPAMSGFLVSLACKIPKSESDAIPFRPPAWVFGPAWLVLYLLMGFAWFSTASRQGAGSWASLTYLATTALLGLWSVTYSCLRQTKNAVFVLLASVASVGFGVALSAKREQLMLIPLLVWLSFATLMNAWQTSLPDAEPASASASTPNDADSKPA